jgi:hypothetical protein
VGGNAVAGAGAAAAGAGAGVAPSDSGEEEDGYVPSRHYAADAPQSSAAEDNLSHGARVPAQ